EDGGQARAVTEPVLDREHRAVLSEDALRGLGRPRGALRLRRDHSDVGRLDLAVERRLRAVHAGESDAPVERARDERSDRAETEDRYAHQPALSSLSWLERLLERGTLAVLHREAVLRIGEASRPDIGVETLEGIDDDRPELGVALRELRFELAEQTEDVVGPQPLPIAIH